MWKVTHERLPTMELSAKWSHGSNICVLCSALPESILHALRDCPLATNVWLAFPCPLPPNFFCSQVLKVWLTLNFTWNSNTELDWRSWFFTTCWFLWFWRNSQIHDTGFTRPADPSKIITAFVTSIKGSWSPRVMHGSISQLRTPTPSWQRPPQGWLKINSDGAVKDLTATCGGILRDDQGYWITGFFASLGSCSPLHAELWGILKALMFAWNFGVSQLEVECDSLHAISLLTSLGNESRQLQLVAKIRDWSSNCWQIRFSHCPRTCNSSADWLAKEAFSRSKGDRTFLHMPPALALLVEADRVPPVDTPPP